MDINEVIESASFLNPPHHSGFWETRCRSFLWEAEQLIRAYAQGDGRAAAQIRRDMDANLKQLEIMVMAAQQTRPMKYTCTDCGGIWRGAGAEQMALMAPCHPYDDEARPRTNHTGLLTATFDEEV